LFALEEPGAVNGQHRPQVRIICGSSVADSAAMVEIETQMGFARSFSNISLLAVEPSRLASIYGYGV
jgi:hypothetical protein